MKKILFLLLCVFGISFSNASERILYIKNITPQEILEGTIYVGQTIPITYSAVLVNGASLQYSSFIDQTTTDNITLKNPNAQWKQIDENNLQITYYFKILSSGAIIPPFEVSALPKNGSYIDLSSTSPIQLNVIDLYQNKKYVGVVADTLQLETYKTRNYDEQNNLLAFEINANNANLEDFRLPDFEKQGIERSNFSPNESNAIFYCILPKNVQNVSFEYFSLSSNRFEEIRIPVIPSTDTIGTQESLKPKNTYLLYSALFMGSIITILVVLSFFFKRFQKILWAIAIILLIYLLYSLFYTKKVTLEVNKHIWVLPTYNSTILMTTQEPINVRVIGKHNQYYKIITNDDIVGWIKAEDAR